MLATLSETRIPTSAFVEVRETINRTVLAFRRRFGGDIEELKAEANYYFCRAYLTCDPSRGKLSKRVAYMIWYGLLSRYSKEVERKWKLPRVTFSEDWEENEKAFDIDKFLANLSDDSANIVRLIFAPEGCWRCLSPDVERAAVCKFLRKLGWTTQRISACWAEIKAAL